MKAWVVLGTLLVVQAAHSAPTRLVLSIGNDLGHVADVPLRYAELDAHRVRDVFVEVGAVKAPDAEVLTGQTASEVTKALGRIGERTKALRAEGRDVFVLVYVSAHAAGGSLHLGETELSLSGLRDAVAALPATLRLLVVDACSSGAAVRTKGGLRARAQVNVDSATRGTVIISSSGPAEAAQEWDSLTSSLFTHHWLAGLRGRADANRDGRVTLQEAYASAWNETVAAGDQHPSYEFELSGSGDFVLTEPARAASAIEFSAPFDGRVVVLREDSSGFVLEVEKRAGAPLRLAVPEGQYLVRRRSEAGVEVAQLTLPPAGVTSLGAADFTPESPAAVARKGPARSAPWSLALELSISGTPTTLAGPVLGPGLWLRWQAASWWLASSVSVAGSTRPNVSPESLIGFSLAVGTHFHVGPARFGLGLVVRPLAVLSDVQRLAVESSAQGSVELRLVGPFFVGAVAELLVRVTPTEPRWGQPFGVRGGLLLGSSF